MSAHDEAYIAKFQPEPNAYVIHADDTGEMKYFPTDASLRRYCMGKRAWCGFRMVDDPKHRHHGMYMRVYPRDDERVVEGKPVIAWDGGEE
jgi:hypothetical protein|tara:strand:+ start:36 stop:308 length:273 start_codon:yes stop_codon:yes gene_type:complete